MFPIVLGALSLGCGLALEAAAGVSLPAALRLVLGLCVVIVVGQLAGASWATAVLAAPLVAVIAAGGLVWSRGHGLWPPDRGAAIAAVGVFAIFAAPIVLSGEATFAGYIKLDDTSTWLAITDRLTSHGRDLSGLVPSTYQLTLLDYVYQSSYPEGWAIPLSVGHALTGEDSAWLFSPLMAIFAAASALAFYELLRAVVRSDALRSAAALVAASSTLLFGYAMWGGIKELAAAFAIAAVAAAGMRFAHEGRRVRGVLPFAFALAALGDILNVGSAPWMLPALGLLLAAALVSWLERKPWPRLILRAAALGIAAAVLALPAIVLAGTFVRGVTPLYSGAPSHTDIGNLLHPLSGFQMAGVWLNGDFRRWPAAHALNTALIAVVVAAAVAGLGWALWRRGWGVVLYGAVALGGAAYLALTSGPWLIGKALAAGSPAIPLAAMLAAALVYERWQRFPGLALALLIAGAVLASDVLAYRDVYLAPRARLAELQHVGGLVAGKGPTLLTEVEVYGSRHLLRAGDPVGASDLRPFVVPLRDGSALVKDGYADLDAFQLAAVTGYRSIVLRRSPTESRPPGYYSLAWRGHYYELWRRLATNARVISHLGLGDVAAHPFCGYVEFSPTTYRVPCSTQAASVPSCARVHALASLASRTRAQLVAEPRPLSVVAPPSAWSQPPGWTFDLTGELAYPQQPGVAATAMTVPAAGRYELWLGGSFTRAVAVAVDGLQVGTVAMELANRGQYLRLGAVTLAAGAHAVTVQVSGAGPGPGTGAGVPEMLGPVILTTSSDTNAPLLSVAAAQAGSLCGRSLDWIEVVAP
ncbi:MAG: hypothetical protein DLM63_02445 [Solirubrobacterales bacterium]|nr:MAG: hypothetical protein DLM63_02445 [Solirubrobacterales bacterium]